MRFDVTVESNPQRRFLESVFDYLHHITGNLSCEMTQNQRALMVEKDSVFRVHVLTYPNGVDYEGTYIVLHHDKDEALKLATQKIHDYLRAS